MLDNLPPSVLFPPTRASCLLTFYSSCVIAGGYEAIVLSTGPSHSPFPLLPHPSSVQELVQAECLIHPANRAELCFVDRYGLAKEGNMSRVEEDAFWPFCRLSNEPHTVQGMGRNSPPPATDVDVSKDQETCNVEEQAVDVDELVDVILDVDGAECELVDAGELADDMFAEDRATYEPTHPRFVPYVSAKETIRDAVEAAKEHHQDFLESLASAMLDADLDLSAEASAGFEPQVRS